MHIVDKVYAKDEYSITFLVESEHDKCRLDKFMLDYFSSFSREFIKKKILRGDVYIKDRPHPHKPSSKIYIGETIKVYTYKHDIEPESWNGKPVELEPDPTVIFEDDDAIFLSKPPFMATHPTGKHLFYCASLYYEIKYAHTIHSVHRLDRETSGVLILAKNPKSAHAITTQFEKTEVKKCYFLIAKYDKSKNIKFPFTANERLDSGENHVNSIVIMSHPENSTKGKKAQTEFELIHKDKDYLIALAFPHTGRQHQIRVHAADHGFPLVGDKIYNGDYTVFERFKDLVATEEDHEKMELNRHALHAVAIKLKYKNKDSLYQAPLPLDLLNWCREKLAISEKGMQEKIKERVENYFAK